MSEKTTPIRQLKPLDFLVKQDPAVPGVEAVSQRPPLPGCHTTPQGTVAGLGPCLAAPPAPGGTWGTPFPPAGPPCASVRCAAAAAAQQAQHTTLLLLLLYGFTDFFSDVTHKIARDGELLHLEFHLTQLPQRISFITVNMELKSCPQLWLANKTVKL